MSAEGDMAPRPAPPFFPSPSPDMKEEKRLQVPQLSTAAGPRLLQSISEGRDREILDNTSLHVPPTGKGKPGPRSTAQVDFPSM